MYLYFQLVKLNDKIKDVKNKREVYQLTSIKRRYIKQMKNKND